MPLKDKIIRSAILLLTIIALTAIMINVIPPGDPDYPPGHTLGRHMLH